MNQVLLASLEDAHPSVPGLVVLIPWTTERWANMALSSSMEGRYQSLLPPPRYRVAIVAGELQTNPGSQHDPLPGLNAGLPSPQLDSRMRVFAGPAPMTRLVPSERV